MNDKVYLVQTLEGKGDVTTFIGYHGVFTTWDGAVAAANRYGEDKSHKWQEPEEYGLYAEHIVCRDGDRFSSVRIIPMTLNKQYNMA